MPLQCSLGERMLVDESNSIFEIFWDKSSNNFLAVQKNYDTNTEDIE